MNTYSVRVSILHPVHESEPYVYGGSERDNKHLENPISGQYLALAKNLLAQNGSLTEAALMLEAAIQRGDLGEGGYEAWILLGETRSMDEREEAGIRALTEGVRIAEAAGASGAGMLVRFFCYRIKTNRLTASISPSQYHTRMKDTRKERIRCSCVGLEHAFLIINPRPGLWTRSKIFHGCQKNTSQKLSLLSHANNIVKALSIPRCKPAWACYFIPVGTMTVR